MKLSYYSALLIHNVTLPQFVLQIDRIMECFAKHYCSQNPGLFDETDTCYIVCFGITMLNTVLHNPAVKHKTTEEQFISQFRGMNSGKDLKRSFLVRLFSTFFIPYALCGFEEKKDNKSLPYFLHIFKLKLFPYAGTNLPNNP